MKKSGRIFYVLFLSLLVRVVLYFFQAHPIWWDTAVYSSMGRYIFSLGRVGLWEPIRPLVFPFFMGFFSGFSPDAVLVCGFVLELVFTLGLVYVTYLVGRELFNEKVGLLASLILSFTPFFFYFSNIPLSGIPSTFFALLAFYFFLKERDIAAGIFAGVAVMTRFPQGLVLVSLFLLCFSLRRFIRVGAAFFFTLAPYLLLNFVLYGNPFFPFIEGSGVIAEAGLWLFQGSWYYYIVELLEDSVLFLFAVVGLASLRNRRQCYVVLPLLLFFVYFSAIPHKELRFAIVFLPYLAILAAHGLRSLVRDKRLFCVLVLAVLVFFAFNVRLETSDGRDGEFYSFLEGQDIKGEVLVSNPIISLYTDAKLRLLYYPVFNSEYADYWMEYIKSDGVGYVFIDTCSGLVCPPGDSDCVTARDQLDSALKTRYEVVFSEVKEGCFYRIFKNPAL